MKKIENKEQLADFCEEQFAWLNNFNKGMRQFLKENLTEDEIKENNILIEDNE